MLKLLLLGRPEITATSEELGHVPFGKPLAVLGYLAFGDVPVPRSELARLLWPESSRSRARHSVREALSRLRGALGEEIFEGEDPIRVRRDLLWIDSDALGEALAAGDLETANALWRGPFLDELVIADAPGWERWKDDARHRLEAAFGRALRRAGAEALDTGRPSHAARWFRRATEIQPYSVSAHKRLLETLLELRRLDVWEDAWRTANEHLAPLDALSELDPIRQRALATREEMRSAELHGGGPTVPFVGRSEELRSMFDAWARVRERRAGTVVLRGGAGVGKTRLAEEFIRRIEENATSVHVRPGAEGSDRPFALIRSLVAELRTRPGSRGTSPDFEPLLEAVEDPERGLRDEWLEPETVAGAISDLLGAVAFEAPIVVLLDDVHRADEASLEVLERVVQRALDAPVLLVVCTREAADDAERGVASRLARAAGERPVTLIELRPFSERGTGRLLHSFLVVPDDGDEAVIHQVQELTQGNALFVVEFVQALFQAGVLRESEGRWTLTTTDLSPVVRESTTVAGLIASRLARLPEDARVVTRCLAEEEGPVPIMDLRDACALDAAPFVRSVALLSEWRIVRWLDDERIDMAHDRFREVGRKLHARPSGGSGRSPGVFAGWAAAAVLVLGVWGTIAHAGDAADGGEAGADAELPPVRGGRLLQLVPEGIREFRPGEGERDWTWVEPPLELPPRWTHQLHAWRTVDGVRWMGTARDEVIAPFAVELHPSSRVDTLFRSEGDDGDPVPSRDGRLAFLTTENPDTDVYDRDLMRLDLETGDTTRIYRGGGVLGLTDRAPTADLLLVHARERPDTLLVMDFEGAVRHRITAHEFAATAWCGPGPEVAASYRSSAGTPMKLAVVNVLTGRIDELVVTQVSGGIACAPDGSAIVFRHVVDSRQRIALFDRDLGTIEVLPEWVPTDGGLTWLPDTLPARARELTIGDVPATVPMGESFEAGATTVYADGSLRREPVAWGTSDPAVLSVLPRGVAHANRAGRVRLWAEGLGGLRDSATIEVTPVAGEPLLLRDRFERLDSTRWYVASEPPPRAVRADEGSVLDFRGDGRYKDALYSRRAFPLPRGGTVEVEFRLEVTRPDRQRVQLCLDEAEPRGPDPSATAGDPLGWVTEQSLCVAYPGGELSRFAEDELKLNGIVHRLEEHLPPDGWTHVALQLRADGEVSLALDREVVVVSSLLARNGPDTRWRVVLGGAAVDTELRFRDLRLWDGPRYGGSER